MARQVERLIAAAVLLVAAFAVHGQPRERDPSSLKTPQVPWYRLSPDEQRILAPVAPEWDRMPGYQQERLKGAARRYPGLQPIQKERFEQRIREWATLTPEQRRQARETFKDLRQLPPERQHELREKWLDRHPDRSEAPRSRDPRGGAPSYREREPRPYERGTR